MPQESLPSLYSAQRLYPFLAADSMPVVHLHFYNYHSLLLPDLQKDQCALHKGFYGSYHARHHPGGQIQQRGPHERAVGEKHRRSRYVHHQCH
jgi:hypothetical protein